MEKKVTSEFQLRTKGLLSIIAIIGIGSLESEIVKEVKNYGYKKC